MKSSIINTVIEEVEEIVEEVVDEVSDVVHAVNLSLFFRVSMWWRILYGFLRVILGVVFLRLVGQSLSELVYALMAHEITGEAGDAVLENIYRVFETHDFTVSYFIASYFIFWGIVDIVLSACLLNHIRRAFPVTMFLIVLFIFYSVFRYAHTHSGILLGVIVIDFFILYLVNREYQKFPVKQ
jgi:uncharacterized membrane protein